MEDRFRHVSKRDEPVFCLHEKEYDLAIIEMVRVFTSFQFTACLAKDLPENQILRLLSGGSSSRSDWLEAERRQARQNEASASSEPDPAPQGISPKDVQECWQAATAGNIGKWREDHGLDKDDYASD